jgi:hypothetical protein
LAVCHPNFLVELMRLIHRIFSEEESTESREIRLRALPLYFVHLLGQRDFWRSPTCIERIPPSQKAMR